VTLADICFVAELSLFSNERTRHHALQQSGLEPILSDAQLAKFPCAMAHFARLADHPVFALRLMCDPIWRSSRPKQNRRRHCASRAIRWFRTFDQLVASAAPFSPRRREPTDHNVLDLLS
jgi:hypothetical protein